MERLHDLVESVAKDIENGIIDCESIDGEKPTAFDYLQDALAIEYVVNSKKEYRGARIMVACGGPNIWINTRTNTVEGYWGSDAAFATYGRDSIGLDAALEDLYMCS